MSGLGIRYENETCGNDKRQEAALSVDRFDNIIIIPLSRLRERGL